MPAPSTPEVRNLHREAQALIEQAAVQQAESSASRIRQQGDTRGDGGAQGGEPSVHTGGATRQPGTHTGERTTPQHAQSTGRRRPQRHQRSADEQSGCASGCRLPPSTRWTLR
jgi:hypothetical protein